MFLRNKYSFQITPGQIYRPHPPIWRTGPHFDQSLFYFAIEAARDSPQNVADLVQVTALHFGHLTHLCVEYPVLRRC